MQPELLAVASSDTTLASLLQTLAEAGYVADIARGVGEARDLFFARGGHRLVLLAPDLTPATSRAVRDSLADLDPAVELVSFGRTGGGRARLGDRVRALDHHPTSRAAAGAVLRLLRAP